MLKGYLKKKQIKTNKKNQRLLCKILSPKKKKKTEQHKKQRKDKSRKRQKVGHEREKDNFVQHTLPPFLPHFLPILERLNCGGPREKMAGPPPLFSPPPPLIQTPFSPIFSPIFHSFFPSSVKSTHPNIV